MDTLANYNPETLNLPEPLPLLPGLTRAAPYPIEQLPQTIRAAAMAIAYHVQAPLGLAAQCVIGAAVYLAQSRTNAPHIHNQNGMPASMFLLTLADSGDRKSECRRLAFRTLDEAEKQLRQNHRIACEKISRFADGLKGMEREIYLAEHPFPTDPRTQFSDATYEPIAGAFIRGMTAASWDTDEGGQVLAGSSLKADTRAATLGGLVRAFDTGNIDRTRASGNMEGSGSAFNRRLSINLLAQPVTVATALNDPLLQGQGFLARFLFASPDSIAGTRLLSDARMQEKAYLDSRLQQFWERCEAIQATPQQVDLEIGEVKPPVMEMTEKAQAEWMAFYNETEREQGALGEFAGIKPFAGRSGELVRRLATVLAYFEGKEEIDINIMASACAITRHSLSEWVRHIESTKPSAILVQAAALMDWLKNKGWTEFSKKQLLQNGPGHVRKAATRDSLLALLLEKHHLLSSDGKLFKINSAQHANANANANSANEQQGQSIDLAGLALASGALENDNATAPSNLSPPVEAEKARQARYREALINMLSIRRPIEPPGNVPWD